jgi:hypothetical protein
MIVVRKKVPDVEYSVILTSMTTLISMYWNQQQWKVVEKLFIQVIAGEQRNTRYRASCYTA